MFANRCLQFVSSFYVILQSEHNVVALWNANAFRQTDLSTSLNMAECLQTCKYLDIFLMRCLLKCFLEIKRVKIHRLGTTLTYLMKLVSLKFLTCVAFLYVACFVCCKVFKLINVFVYFMQTLAIVHTTMSS